MEFALSEDERMLQESVDRFLQESAPMEAVREAIEDTAATRKIADGLSELGLAGVMVPEAEGGLGLGALEAALIQEALGRAVAPARFIGDAVAADVLSVAGDEASKVLLRGLAAGEVRFGLGLTELTAKREHAGLRLKGGELGGRAMFVLDWDGASHLLLAADEGLCLVDVKDAAAAPLETIDRTRRFVRLDLHNAPATLLKGADPMRALRLARLLLAADTLGAAGTMILKAVEYAKERKQFGRVIGSFQAVKHLCAEMAAELEPARALVWHAAHAFDTGDAEAMLMADLAKSHLSEIGTFIARTATEVHGGMGFTDDLGLHFWFKRIGVNRQLFGGPEQVRADAAKAQGWA